MTKGNSKMLGWGRLLLLGAMFVLAPAARAQDEGDPPPTLDEEYAQLAEQIPGFGGLYIDDRGTTHVYLQDLSQTDEVQGLGETVEVHQGQYDFRDLFAWKDVLRSQLARGEVVMLDIDEARNRLLFGVERAGLAAFQADLEGVLRTAGIPAEAVLVEESEPIVPLELLTDTIRPVPAGVQISRPLGGGFIGICTLGVNAVRSGVQGFVTNSHCTATQGAVEGSVFSQSIVSSQNQVGVETVDPPLFMLSGGCPSTRICRRSDAAFVTYNAASLAEQGQIANPVVCNFPDPFNTGLPRVVSSVVPRLQITAAVLFNLPVGVVATKVGRTTGCTSGTLIATCVDSNVGGSIITMLCQNRVGAISMGGDSGSPVFVRSSDEAFLLGILWGGTSSTFVYSPWANVTGELGSLDPL